MVSLPPIQYAYNSAQKILDIILNKFISGQQEEESGLTSREKEIIQLIAEGKSSKDIC